MYENVTTIPIIVYHCDVPIKKKKKETQNLFLSSLLQNCLIFCIIINLCMRENT